MRQNEKNSKNLMKSNGVNESISDGGKTNGKNGKRDSEGKPESVKLKNQISSKVSLQAKNKAKSSHSKCTQKVHENWKSPAFYAIIEVDKSGIGCGKNEL